MTRVSCAVALLLVLSGCSPGPSESLGGTEPSPGLGEPEVGGGREAATEAESTPASGGPDPGPTDDGALDPTGARPSVTREELLQEWWSAAGLEGDPEPVELVREVSDGEYLQVQRECMTDAGWPPTDDGLSFSAPAGQAEALSRALYVCWAQYPTPLAHRQPYDRDQLEMIYDWYVEEAIPCIEAEGHVVTGLPSRETFASTYLAGGHPWLPFDGLSLGPQQSVALEDACPMMPPLEDLFSGR